MPGCEVYSASAASETLLRHAREMTTEGRERVDRAISRLLTAEAELLDALSPVDQERLAALLRKLSLDFD